MTDFTPTRADKLSIGLWTVGWQGVDVFGGAVRPSLEPAEAVNKLAELGAYGITFHDNDVFPSGSTSSERDEHLKPFRAALDETGLAVPMVTTNLFSHPAFRDGGFTNNDRDIRRFAIRKVADDIDLAAELGAETFVAWGGREGAESGATKDVRSALHRYKETFDVLGSYAVERGYDMRIAIEPKPNERHGDILLTHHRSRARVHQRARALRPFGAQPGGRPRRDGEPPLCPRPDSGAVARQALSRRPQRTDRSPRYDQDLRFGAGDACGAFGTVDILENGGYEGPRHFDFKPPRTEDMAGVWVSAEACMRNYLILRVKARAFRGDPDVQRALTDARLDQLAQPALASGETVSALRGEVRPRRGGSSRHGS